MNAVLRVHSLQTSVFDGYDAGPYRLPSRALRTVLLPQQQARLSIPAGQTRR